MSGVDVEQKGVAPAVPTELVWLVYYKPGLLGNPGPPTLIGIARSAEEASAMVTETQAYETKMGWDHPKIGIVEVPVGINHVAEDKRAEDGPVILD